MTKIINCHHAQIKAADFAKKASQMSEAVYLRKGDEALLLLNELVFMATELNRSVNSWKFKFDEVQHE